MTEEQKPKLDECSFLFTQESNCMNASGMIETIEIKCMADIGIDNSEGCFYEIKTEGWSIDNVGELQDIFDRINKSLFPNKESKPKQ
jgi:hypothetical protein